MDGRNEEDQVKGMGENWKGQENNAEDGKVLFTHNFAFFFGPQPFF